MKSGQFYRGKIDGIQKRFESQGARNLLPKEKLDPILDITDIGEFPHFFKQDLVLVKTVVKEADNSDGREGGVTNHTVLYKFDKSVEHESFRYIFDLEEFISQVLAGERRFKMPPTPDLPDADAGLILSPPPIEWEVNP